MAEVIDIGIAAQNAADPEAPEYNKGYKKEQHSSCCGSCGETNCNRTTSTSDETTVTRRTNTREDYL